jgi:micrococcal nuclease
LTSDGFRPWEMPLVGFLILDRGTVAYVPGMNTSIRTLLVALFVALPAARLNASDEPDAPHAKIVRVVDGDTVKLILDGRQVTARIIGIDAPESVHPRKPVERFGKEAAEHLRQLADGKEVTIERQPGSKQDRYGRELVYLRLADDRDIGLTMIRDGYAFAYTKYPFARKEDYRQAEREARETKAGLWGDDSSVTTTWGPL